MNSPAPDRAREGERRGFWGVSRRKVLEAFGAPQPGERAQESVREAARALGVSAAEAARLRDKHGLDPRSGRPGFHFEDVVQACGASGVPLRATVGDPEAALALGVSPSAIHKARAKYGIRRKSLDRNEVLAACVVRGSPPQATVTDAVAAKSLGISRVGVAAARQRYGIVAFRKSLGRRVITDQVLEEVLARLANPAVGVADEAKRIGVSHNALYTALNRRARERWAALRASRDDARTA